jgi:3-dehydroquinate synthase
MTSDKQRELGRTAFILARGIGQAFVDKSVDLAQIAAFLDGAR